MLKISNKDCTQLDFDVHRLLDDYFNDNAGLDHSLPVLALWRFVFLVL